MCGGATRITLPGRLAVHGFGYALDGGTTWLKTTDETGRERGIMLVQHGHPQPSSSWQAVPGRLYFDGELIPLRSPTEAGIISLLRIADVNYTGAVPDHPPLPPDAAIFGGGEIRQVLTGAPQESLRMLVDGITRFVESDEYLRFAERVERAADPTRYTVWPMWDATTRNRVAVRLGRVLGIGYPAAREMLDNATPLAEGVSALEAAALAERYGAEGLPLCVEPPFRWQMPAPKGRLNSQGREPLEWCRQ